MFLILFLNYGKCSKIPNTKKERTPEIYFLSTAVKQREVTSFAKGDNLILPPFAKLVTFLTEFLGIFLFEIKIVLYEFLKN